MKEGRRRYTRIDCRTSPFISLPVLFEFSRDEVTDGYRDGWGVIDDISLGGVKIETRSPMWVGQTVFLSFTIADTFVFANAKGIVRRVTSKDGYHTCGIEFESLVDKQHLQDGLAALQDMTSDNQTA